MRAFLIIVALLAAPSATAEDRASRAALQAALALDGRYDGPIDGAWGPASARAADGADRGTLLRRLSHEWTAAGWRPVRGPENGPGALVPMGLLRPGSGEGLEYVTPGGDLSVAFVRRDGTGTMALHHWLERSAAGPLEREDDPGRLVSEGRLADGTRVHLWSHFRSELDARTVVVRWRAPETRRARLVTASIATGAVPSPAVPARARIAGAPRSSLVPPPRPARAAEPVRLAAIRPAPRAAQAADLAEAARPEADLPELEEVSVQPELPAAPGPAMPGPPPGTVIGTGTGFFVGPRQIVTNAHVVGPCASIRTAGGLPVTLAATDIERDLALVVAETASEAWMPLQGEEPVRLGAPVRVIGFPFGGAYHDGVSVTSGLVSARGASWVGAERLMISAPIQPGNSGGPVLATSGEVIGVVTSRLNSADGTPLAELPQNMAYAVPAAALADFLQDSEYDPPAREARGIEEGLPEDAERAVVHLLCMS